MHPLVIVSIGVAIVIGGVLILRLHAFLALLLAALTVAALTPTKELWRFAILDKSAEVANLTIDDPQLLESYPGDWQPREKDRLKVLKWHAEEHWFIDVGDAQIAEIIESEEGEKQVRVELIAVGENDLAEVTQSRLIHEIDWRRAMKPPGFVTRVVNAFGSTAAKIAILIAMASIIGKCLLDSGAADRIVRSSLALFGERAAPLAFLGSGFTLAIPVFFDTVFYLMIPLGKAMRVRTGRNYMLYVLSIVAGGTMAHSLVPPTPGPLFVAEELGVDLGIMILAGCALGVFTAGSGYLFALWLNARWDLPLRDSAEMSLAELEQLAKRDDRELPPLSLSLLPILLPVVLIGGQTIVKRLDLGDSPSVALLTDFMAVVGDKNIALIIAAAIALLLLAWKKRTTRKQLATAVGAALAGGGVIILITAAGGAFGGVMRQTGVASLIEQMNDQPTYVLLLAGFFITTAIRTAQGSSTVAMITAVGILAPLADPAVLGCNPVYLALSIGCGSKPISWMNDSGFWVMCQMSGMTETEGLKSITPMSALMAVVGLAIILLAAAFMPLA